MALTSFFLKCKRVWQVLRKPGMQEFSAIAKVSALGIAAIGLVGFVINLLMHIVK